MSAESESSGAALPRRKAVIAGAAAVSLVALALLLIVSRPRRTGPVRASAVEAPATVTGEPAELRRAPSADAPVTAQLARGARVTVTADRGRWLQVRTSAGQDGFLLQETVETDADRDARQKRASKVLSFSPVFGVVAEETDVLLAPFPLAARDGRLRKGETVPIHAVDHDYYAFRANDGSLAFVRSADVDLVPPDPRRPVIVAEPAKALKDLQIADLSGSTTPPPSTEGGETEAEPAVRAAAEEEPAVLSSKADPRYPEAARRAGVEGTVVLDATIDESGTVTDLQVLRGLPLGLSEAAVDAVSRWKYRPARGRNGPVTSHKTIRIVFRLGD